MSQSLAASLIAFAVTGLTWLWSVWVWSRLGQHRGQGGHASYRPTVTFCFLAALALEALSVGAVSRAADVVVALAAAGIYLLFAIDTARNRESFWSKRRNRLVGTAVVAALAVALGLIVAQPAFLPLVSALAMTHSCQGANARAFAQAVSDLEALRLKVQKLEAGAHTRSVIEKLEAAPVEASLVTPSRDSRLTS